TGRLAYEMGDFTVARQSFLAASNGLHPLDDKFAVIPYDLGWVALGEGNLNEAESYFRQSLSAAVSQKRAPYGMYGLVGLAACKLRGGAAAAEATDWLKAVVCDPRTHYRVRLKGQELLGEEITEPSQPFDWLAVIRPLLDAERIKG
ncbi:MAG: hypothetical protein KDE51_22455, partial [Anaerolineales bacterium]|nr:hypothetical protein [Anaerolineales bacterium]